MRLARRRYEIVMVDVDADAGIWKFLPTGRPMLFWTRGSAERVAAVADERLRRGVESSRQTVRPLVVDRRPRRGR